MKVNAINGSPRKSWNNAMLLENALQGAVAQGAGPAMQYPVEHTIYIGYNCSFTRITEIKSGNTFPVKY